MPRRISRKKEISFDSRRNYYCPDWQKGFVNELKDTNLILLNPRRDYFDLNDVKMSISQIKWEYVYLEKADAVSFWFPKETLCPITLYELGKMSALNKKIFVGIDPNYKRLTDIVIQTGLIRPEVNIKFDLKDLANQIKQWEKLK